MCLACGVARRSLCSAEYLAKSFFPSASLSVRLIHDTNCNRGVKSSGMLHHTFADVSKERSTFVISEIWKMTNTTVTSLERKTSRSAVHVSIKFGISKCSGMWEFWFKPGSVLRFAGVSLIPPLPDSLGSFIYTWHYINLATGNIVKQRTSPMILYRCKGCGVAGKYDWGPAVRKGARNSTMMHIFIFLDSNQT